MASLLDLAILVSPEIKLNNMRGLSMNQPIKKLIVLSLASTLMASVSAVGLGQVKVNELTDKGKSTAAEVSKAPDAKVRVKAGQSPMNHDGHEHGDKHNHDDEMHNEMHDDHNHDKDMHDEMTDAEKEAHKAEKEARNADKQAMKNEKKAIKEDYKEQRENMKDDEKAELDALKAEHKAEKGDKTKGEEKAMENSEKGEAANKELSDKAKEATAKQAKKTLVEILGTINFNQLAI